jgi:hypothetical protein
MKIHIRTTTGQGITIQGTLNSSDLSQPLAQSMETLMRPTILAAAAEVSDNPHMVDMQEYEITLFPKGRKSNNIEQFQFTDASCPDELLDLLDELIHEIVRQKKHAPK